MNVKIKLEFTTQKMPLALVSPHICCLKYNDFFFSNFSIELKKRERERERDRER